MMKTNYRILFTSPGRRVELINLFRDNFPKNSKFFGTDFDSTSPASYFLDKVFKVPYKIDDDYAKSILGICVKNKIDLVIPLIDPDLFYLSKIKSEFTKNNIFLMVSDIDKIRKAYNKYETFLFLIRNNLPTPRTILASEDLTFFKFPVIIKPIYGSASKGIKIIEKLKQLENYSNILNSKHVIQELIKGDEITVSTFGDENGICYEMVQRKRLKIRGGEVERGVTIKNNFVAETVEKFVEAYKPNGAINIQLIGKDNDYKIIEINPRFGGGYPLAHQAGANFPKLLLNKLSNKKNIINIGNYTENLYMLRYDKAIYTKELVKLC